MLTCRFCRAFLLFYSLFLMLNRSFALSTQSENQSTIFSGLPENEAGDSTHAHGESPFRRGEIVFFVSLPFMLATHFIAGSLLYLGLSGENSLNSMHPGYVGVLFASSVFFSLAIAIDDYQTVSRKNPESAKNAEDVKFLRLTFRF